MKESQKQISIVHFWEGFFFELSIWNNFKLKELLSFTQPQQCSSFATFTSFSMLLIFMSGRQPALSPNTSVWISWE